MGAEGAVMHGLGLKFQYIFSSDPKQAAVTFMRHNPVCNSEHHVKDMLDVTQGVGDCTWHKDCFCFCSAGRL